MPLNAKRERDVRNWMLETLQASGYFDPNGVCGGVEAYEESQSAGARRMVLVEPQDNNVADVWSGSDEIMDYVDVRLRMTFAAREADGLKADDVVELLFDAASNLLTNSDLGGLAMPAFSKFSRSAWERPQSPTRRLVAQFNYRYLVDEGRNVDE